jgi:hypothetical protein
MNGLNARMSSRLDDIKADMNGLNARMSPARRKPPVATTAAHRAPHAAHQCLPSADYIARGPARAPTARTQQRLCAISSANASATDDWPRQITLSARHRTETSSTCC